MEMSPEYMREAAEGMQASGFALEVVERHVDGQVDMPATDYILTKESDVCLVLECVQHPTEGHAYYLEIRAFHGLRSFSFPLDSWKIRGDRIEFKYYQKDDTGLGLSLTLAL